MPLEQEGGGARRRAAQPCSSRRRRRTGPPKFLSVAERIWPPGAPTSGFSRCPKAVSPPDEKLVTMPLRLVSSSCGSRPIRIAVRPPRLAEIGAQRGAVEVGDHPARDGELDRDAVGLAGPVVDEDDSDRARGAHARGLQRERAVAARDERDRPGQRAGGQRRRAAVEVAGRAAEIAWHRSAVRAHDRADVDELLVGVRPGRRRRSSGGADERDVGERVGSSGRGDGERRRRRRGSWRRAATEIASGAVPGEPAEPRP